MLQNRKLPNCDLDKVHMTMSACLITVTLVDASDDLLEIIRSSVNIPQDILFIQGKL